VGKVRSKRCYILIGPEDEERVRESAAGQAPRLDYRELADLVSGTIVEGAAPPAQLKVTKPLAVLRSVIPNFAMAFRLLRQVEGDSVILSTGETWGVPVGLAMGMAPRPDVQHFVYVHRVFSSNWRRFLRLFGAHLAVDGWFCVTSKQKRVLKEILGDSASVEVISQGVDTRFFSPEQAGGTYAGGRPYILTVGAEMRDYGLLFEAVSPLNIPVMVLASSNWMTGQRQRIAKLPPNVKLIERRLNYCELRDLYAGAAVVVVPLQNTLQAAGITTILEAMAMHKMVIATRSEGLPDILVHTRTGKIVDADAGELAVALKEMLDAFDKYEPILERASALVQEEASIESFAARIAEALSPECSA
jgi:glycosyltransferase involved in cell wall biosynthesis